MCEIRVFETSRFANLDGAQEPEHAPDFSSRVLDIKGEKPAEGVEEKTSEEESFEEESGAESKNMARKKKTEDKDNSENSKVEE